MGVIHTWVMCSVNATHSSIPLGFEGRGRGGCGKRERRRVEGAERASWADGCLGEELSRLWEQHVQRPCSPR